MTKHFEKGDEVRHGFWGRGIVAHVGKRCARVDFENGVLSKICEFKFLTLVEPEPTTRQPEPCANDGCDELIWETMPGAWMHILQESNGRWSCIWQACKPLATTPRVATPRKEEG